MQDALMVALPAGLGGGLLAAATPELAAAAQAVLAGCQSAAILCLNQAGILTAEVATPGGVGQRGSLPSVRMQQRLQQQKLRLQR